MRERMPEYAEEGRVLLWREHVTEDTDLAEEALGHAVSLRDAIANGDDSALVRALSLVDVLTALCQKQ